jgi:hypothetical protein
MATVNLGRIKPIFKGAYSGSTAYVVDDIVTHGNETFICIQAHGAGTQATTQTAYWTKLAAKGTDGTDLTSTLTTVGDIVYHDGSALARLARGAANQQLAMNSGATAPEWITADAGKTLKVVRQIYSNTAAISSSNLNGTTFGDYPSNVEISITPSSPTSIIKFEKSFHYYFNNTGGTNWNHLYERVMYKYSSSSPTSYTQIPTAKGNGGLSTQGLGGHLGTVVAGDHSGQSHNFWQHTKPYVMFFHDHDTPAGETLTYKLQVRSAHAGSSVNWNVNKNQSGNHSDSPGIICLTEMDI